MNHLIKVFENMFGLNILRNAIKYFGDDEEPIVPEIPSGEDLFNQGLAFSQQNFPGALGAREQGLAALPSLEVGPEFFQRFSPTTFEQGLATSAFQPLLEQAQRNLQIILEREY